MKLSIRSRVAITVAAVALVAAACGSDDSSSDNTTATTASSATSGAGASTETTAAPSETTAAPSDGGLYGEDPATAPPETTAGGEATGGGAVSVDVSSTSLGDVLTSDGLTLYIFTPDNAGVPTCVDACAAAWPPLTTEDSATAGTGLTAADLTTVARPDGTMQVAYHGWPLYFYAEDTAAGDVIGQGVGGKWFVIGADGTPIEA